jgi:hypothetical protein
MTAAAAASLAEALATHLRATPEGGPDLTLVETHISVLLLGATRAWKLKKPLTLDFLDFGSVAARRHACEEELRINRRTAPQVYLAVRPVLGPAQAPRLGRADDAGDAAQAIDWVVEMRRFDERQGLDRLATRGALTPDVIDRMAQAMAALHGPAPLDPEEAPDVTPLPPVAPDNLRHWIDDNLASLRTLPGAAPWQDEVAALQRWSDAHHARLAPLIARRHRSGRVRECHGDLHLGNWVWLDGAPVAFDAIEFEPRLRWIDVVADLAFPFMDLRARGLHGLAWRLASTWFEQTGDFDGAPLLAWCAVYCALVRVKIALIEAAQADDAPARAERLARARAGLDLARTLAAEADARPVLFALGGLSGAGKSTVGQCCVEQFGALRLRSDVERKRLAGMTPRQRPGQDGAPDAAQLYGREATERTYDRLGALAQRLLAGGLSVVFDAASLRVDERAARRRLADAAGAHHLLLHCVAPPAVLAARLQARQARGDDPSDADVAVMTRQADFAEPLGADEQAEAVVIDTDRPRETLCAAVARQIGAALAAARAGP